METIKFIIRIFLIIFGYVVILNGKEITKYYKYSDVLLIKYIEYTAGTIIGIIALLYISFAWFLAYMYLIKYIDSYEKKEIDDKENILEK
jgi:hypothetical protein